MYCSNDWRKIEKDGRGTGREKDLVNTGGQFKRLDREIYVAAKCLAKIKLMAKNSDKLQIKASDCYNQQKKRTNDEV